MSPFLSVQRLVALFVALFLILLFVFALSHQDIQSLKAAAQSQ
jgi:uncharacterized integral membrane protein